MDERQWGALAHLAPGDGLVPKFVSLIELERALLRLVLSDFQLGMTKRKWPGEPDHLIVEMDEA